MKTGDYWSTRNPGWIFGLAFCVVFLSENTQCSSILFCGEQNWSLKLSQSMIFRWSIKSSSCQSHGVMGPETQFYHKWWFQTNLYRFWWQFMLNFLKSKLFSEAQIYYRSCHCLGFSRNHNDKLGTTEFIAFAFFFSYVHCLDWLLLSLKPCNHKKKSIFKRWINIYKGKKAL